MWSLGLGSQNTFWSRHFLFFGSIKWTARFLIWVSKSSLGVSSYSGSGCTLDLGFWVTLGLGMGLEVSRVYLWTGFSLEVGLGGLV